MSKEDAIVLKNIGMKFNLSKEKVDSLKDYVIQSLRHQIQYNEFWALKDINLTIKKGERVGILGLNGAGKSTLLKVIAGVFKPTEGTLEKHGKIAPLLELGAGFENNIREKKIFICMVQCLGIQNNLLMKNMMRLSNFLNWASLLMFQ